MFPAAYTSFIAGERRTASQPGSARKQEKRQYRHYFAKCLYWLKTPSGVERKLHQKN